MLSNSELRRLTVVLVGARNPGNIGAAARAMRDFGFSDLRVVNDFSPPLEAAQLQAEQRAADDLGPASVSAVGAAEVLRSARRFDRLADAIADCTLIAATTAIGDRTLTQPVLTLQQAATRLRSALADRIGTEGKVGEHRVALLFGSEKTGLTNEQLSYSSLLLTIPLFAPNGRHLSMNLGQAVALCLYELVREGFEGSRALPEMHERLATEADRERLAEALLELMRRSGYARRFPANARQTVVRRLAGHLGQTYLEYSTWLGLLKMLWRWGDPGGTGLEDES